MITSFGQSARWTVWDKAEYARRCPKAKQPPTPAVVPAKADPPPVLVQPTVIPPEAPKTDASAELAQVASESARVVDDLLLRQKCAQQEREITALRAELTTAKLDIDFWKGEAALKESGLEAVRKAFDLAGVTKGALHQRPGLLAADRDREHQRALRAESSYRTLTARLPRELQDQTAIVSIK